MCVYIYMVCIYGEDIYNCMHARRHTHIHTHDARNIRPKTKVFYKNKIKHKTFVSLVLIVILWTYFSMYIGTSLPITK